MTPVLQRIMETMVTPNSTAIRFKDEDVVVLPLEDPTMGPL